MGASHDERMCACARVDTCLSLASARTCNTDTLTRAHTYYEVMHAIRKYASPCAPQWLPGFQTSSQVLEQQMSSKRFYVRTMVKVLRKDYMVKVDFYTRTMVKGLW